MLWLSRQQQELISLNKHELNKDPIDLIQYIVNNNITKPDRPPVWINYELINDGNYKQIMNTGNPRQVFDYILSSTTEDRLKSYIDVIQRFRTCTMPQSENIFFVITLIAGMSFFSLIVSIFLPDNISMIFVT